MGNPVSRCSVICKSLVWFDGELWSIQTQSPHEECERRRQMKNAKEEGREMDFGSA
jgi:hypothetical protein